MLRDFVLTKDRVDGSGPRRASPRRGPVLLRRSFFQSPERQRRARPRLITTSAATADTLAANDVLVALQLSEPQMLFV